MKKLILIGLVFLLTIFSVNAIGNCPVNWDHWMDTNGDCYLGGDDLADVYNLNDGLITEFNFNGLICPVTIWDLNGDGVVNSNDNIYDIAQEVANSGMYNGIIKGSPRKLTLRKEANGDYIAKVTTDSALTGFPEVGRACVGVYINGEQYFTDENGEVTVNNLGDGETITATIELNENKQISDMEAGCSQEIPGNGIDEDCNGVDMKISGMISTPLYDNLYHTRVDLYVNGDIVSTVYTGDFDAPLGYYEFTSNAPGNAYVKFSKPGFVTEQTSSFDMNVDTATYDETLLQNNAIAGGLTGILYDLGMNPQGEVMLLIRDSTGIIQMVQSDEIGIYNVAGLPGTSISTEVYDVGHGWCTIYGGEDIPIVPGVTRTQDIYIDCAT